MLPVVFLCISKLFLAFHDCKSQVPAGHIFIFAWTIDLYTDRIAVFFGGSECFQLFLLFSATNPKNNRGVF